MKTTMVSIHHRSRNSIAAFDLAKPTSVSEALEIFAREPDALPIAGGLDLLNRMKEGLAPRKLVMLTTIPELRAIEMPATDNVILIGATVRHDDIATNAMIGAHLPDLATCWNLIANIRIRAQGTAVGNLLAGRESYEGSLLLGVLQAELSMAVPGDLKSGVLVSELGSQDGSIRPFHGLVLAVRVPLPADGHTRRLVYDRSLRPALSVALCLDSRRGRITAARAALGGGHRRPIFRELKLAGCDFLEARYRARDAAAEAFRNLPRLTVPWFGEPTYRERVAPILLARLIAAATR